MNPMMGNSEKEELYFNRKRRQQNQDQGGANICYKQLGGGGTAKRLQMLNGAKHKLQIINNQYFK